MLRFLNERKRSQKLIWVFISVIVVFGMVMFYAPTRGIPGTSSNVSEDELIAKVGDKEITALEYTKSLDLLMRAYQGFLSKDDSGMTYASLKTMGLDKTALNNLIKRKIIAMEVERLGLETTDRELQNHIREQFTVDGKWVGFDKYKKFVERSGQSLEEYEQSLRESLAEEKLRSFVTGSVSILKKEIQEQFNRENTSFNLVYTVAEPAEFLDKIKPTEEELRAFFEQRKEDFKSDKKQRKIDYVYVSQEQVSKTMTISDEELRKDFDPEKHIAGIRVSQIVIKYLVDKDEPTAREKANELVSRARGTLTGKPEDFAALARGYSQDTTTKDKGGDLGFIKREDIKPGSYLMNALNLKEGEISDPIHEGKAYYILKLVERRTKTFEEAKEALLASARNRLSYKRASEIADEAAKLLREKKDIKAVAAIIAEKIGSKPEETYKQTPFFAEGDDVPDIGSNPSFEEATAKLKPGDVGEKVGIRGGFAIPMLADTREPGLIPSFDEAKTKVEQKYKQEKAREICKQKVQAAIAAAAGKADALKASAEKEGLKTYTKDDYKVGSYLDSAGSGTQLEAAIMQLKEGTATDKPVVVSDRYIAIAAVKRTEPDMTKFNEQSRSIEERLAFDRREMTFNAYIDGIKKKLKESGKLVVYKETLDKIFGPEQTASK